MTSFLLVLSFFVVMIVDVVFKLPDRRWFNWVVSAFIIVIGLAFFFGPFTDSRYLAWLIFTSVSWAHIAAQPILRRRSGRILRALKQLDGGSFLVGVIMFTALAGFEISNAVDWYTQGSPRSVNYGFESLCKAIAFMTAAAQAYLWFHGQHLITETGIIFSNRDVIHWEQITSYEWTGGLNNQLLLRLQLHWPKIRSLTISPEDKQDVIQLMKQYVQQPIDTMPLSDSAVSAS